MQEDSSNGESTFEFIDKRAEDASNEMKQSDNGERVASTSSLLSNIAPPAALPSFVPLPSETKSPQSFYPTTFSPVIPLDKGIAVTSPSLNTTAATVSSATAGGLFSWVKDTVGNNITKVAEKAKSSVDSMITTLDPQMRDFLSSSSSGDVEIIVASDKEVKISPIREAFQSVFGKANVRGLAAEARTVASQPVGYEAGLKGAWLRIEAIRSLHPEGPIIAIENFLVLISQDKWYDAGAIVLSDVGCGLALEVFTQFTPVPSAIVALAQEDTPADYPLAGTGFAVTIGSLMASNLHVHPSEWHQALTGVSRREMLLLSARTLANIYKNSLL